ncbi:2-hydroxyacyl-CoA dehydratase family protein [Pelotomaculum terephthalicicum JT]|uniref:2-hydroxyacyl-CoA dehydratase subunit D n=1 Tax=Pelotomaculum terephthalicicum TaxID=206393 RepID=UPI0009C6DE94|nr:2-hydroxyacyl-CoA dehydratase family protein [Pelotomaculum terephthalicicum]MCG9966528.1 2-hydroxyacyl-CoA dehydratase family protein [Pelotomaculum terephthalicicum JT]OPY62812.1 MAG: R-phenyllactate dehydratase beta subunit [Pelotomaculum sp. PtaU1.Bin065]
MPARKHAKKIYEHFNKIVADPVLQIKRLKKTGSFRIIGWVPTDVPEELIHAAGALPIGIVALERQAVSLSTPHMQVWSCSLMRCALGMALEGSFDLLNGLIIPVICDTTRMVTGIWKQVKPYAFMDNFLLPKQVDRPSAKDYLIGEMGRLKARLEQFMDRTITASELCASIRLYNHNRSVMRKLFSLHTEHPELLSNRNMYNIIKSSMLMPKELHTNMIAELWQELEKKVDDNKSAGKKCHVRLLLSGKVWEPPVIMDIFDGLDIVSAGDDFCTGYRYIANDVPETGEPLRALAERQFNRLPIAAFAGKSGDRAKSIIKMVEETHAHGVLFVHLKYCEPENFDYPMLRDDLSAYGIPNCRIETEIDSLPGENYFEQIKAFIDSIGGVV